MWHKLNTLRKLTYVRSYNKSITFGFTQDTNSGLPGEGPVFDPSIHTINNLYDASQQNCLILLTISLHFKLQPALFTCVMRLYEVDQQQPVLYSLASLQRSDGSSRWRSYWAAHRLTQSCLVTDGPAPGTSACTCRMLKAGQAVLGENRSGISFSVAVLILHH